MTSSIRRIIAVAVCSVAAWGAGCTKQIERQSRDLFEPDARVRIDAAIAIGRDAATDEPRSSPTAQAKALQVLLGESRSADDAERGHIFETLARWAPKLPPEAEPTLLRGLDDADFWTRAHSAAAIYRQWKGRRLPPPDQARWEAAVRTTVRDLPSRLESPDPAERARAARLAADIEARAKDVAPLLVRLVDDPDLRVRIEALTAIAEMHGARMLAVDRWMRLLGDESAQIRHLAAQCLAEYHPEAIGPLVAALRGAEDWSLRGEAADALRMMGPPARVALPALRDALESESSFFTRRTIEMAIEELEGRPPSER